ncbi:Non-reducing end beta-L-arabinofuranosidase [subsurface metagenome]
MPVEKIYANPQVRESIGKVALQRGPIIYCLEEVDNGANLPAIYFPANTEFSVKYKEDILGGVIVISGEALRLDDANWTDNLYRAKEIKYNPVKITAVPYYAWGNREVGEMLVWIGGGC